MKESVLSLYNSLIVSSGLLQALKNKRHTTIVAGLGMHRTLTYLKAILQNLSIPTLPTSSSIENLYIPPSQSKSCKQKFLVFTPNQYMATFLYSTCRTVSPAHQILRNGSELSKHIGKILNEQKEKLIKVQNLIPDADIVFTSLTNPVIFKHANPEFIVFDGIPKMKKSQIFKNFPNAKILNVISSGDVGETTEIKLDFPVHAKELLLKLHRENDLILLLKKPCLKIVVFPSENVLKNFAAEFKKHFNCITFNSNKFWYQLAMTNFEFLVLATLDEVDGVCFPFDAWIFYELPIKKNIHYARSGAENYFLG